MKKFFSIFFFFLISLSIDASDFTFEKPYTNYSIGGYWGEWKKESTIYKFMLQGHSLIQYYHSAHPSEFMWRLRYDEKYYAVDGEWEVYHGTFEYYITDEHPTLLSLLKSGNWIDPRYHDVSKGQTPCVKKIENVKVKRTVENRVYKQRIGYNFWGNPKYGKIPCKNYTYNIFFDNGAFAISYDVYN